MQVREFLPDEVDILMRRRIETELFHLANAKAQHGPVSSILFDCREFGFCLVEASEQGWRPHWYREQPKRKTAKPRIVVTVTHTDGIWKNIRSRWSFALSKLGYLYCVAYEGQRREDGLWVTTEFYRSWQPKHCLMDSSVAVPEDWVFREAERLFKRRKK
jgi:hypothetical protein